jgi:drug/metabolite transporter (DMT)-like permease
MTATETAAVTHRTAKVAAALLAVYVMWGSVYVAIRVVVEEAPPLVSIGLRYVVAALLLGMLAVSRSGLQTLALDRATALSCLLLAILLPGLANGLVTIAVSEGVAAGPAALLTALSPLIIVLLRLVNHDRPPRMTLVGVVVGFAGLAVLLLLGRPSTGFPLWPSVLVLVAANCWALGSFIQPRLTLPRNILTLAAYESLGGGLLLTAAGLTSGEQISADYSAQTWWTLAYLTISSTVTFTAYTWLLSNAPISLVSTHAYVNPVVAVFLGWLLLAEPLSMAVLIGGAIVIGAVAIVITAEQLRGGHGPGGGWPAPWRRRRPRPPGATTRRRR